LELQRGDVLVRANMYEPILSLHTEKRARHKKVFMINLESEHTFYAAGYVVHNKMMLEPPDIFD
jgi:hypothetical protein